MAKIMASENAMIIARKGARDDGTHCDCCRSVQQFSRIAEQVNRSGREVIVFRHSKPWVKISPVTKSDSEAEYVDVMDAIIARSRRLRIRQLRGRHRSRPDRG